MGLITCLKDVRRLQKLGIKSIAMTDQGAVTFLEYFGPHEVVHKYQEEKPKKSEIDDDDPVFASSQD